MVAFLDAIRLSIEGMLFALVLPQFWVALGLLGVSILVAIRLAPSPRIPPASLVISLYAIPPIILICAIQLQASRQGAPPGRGWQEWLVIGLCSLQAVVAAGLVILRRRAWIPVAAFAVPALLWASGAAFIAGMAIRNDWL